MGPAPPAAMFFDLIKKSMAETLVFEETLCYNMNCVSLQFWFGKNWAALPPRKPHPNGVL